MGRIADNVARVKQQIVDAAARSGRDANAVTLVAVTKYVGVEEARAIIDAGCLDLGESRPQELWKKRDELADPSIRWHMIGHLQRNKVRRSIAGLSLLHSGDSERLLKTVDECSADESRKQPILLEINISGDETKHGMPPEDVESHLASLAKLSHVEIRGLMAMASRAGGVDRARQDFVRLRELRDQLSKVCPPEIRLDELSMGMSGDFKVAIEEGATLVRVGSALFE